VSSDLFPFQTTRRELTPLDRYHNLGYEWASTLLAFIALGCCLIPLVFYFKGPAIRKYSKYAYSGDE